MRAGSAQSITHLSAFLPSASTMHTIIAVHPNRDLAGSLEHCHIMQQPTACSAQPSCAAVCPPTWLANASFSSNTSTSSLVMPARSSALGT